MTRPSLRRAANAPIHAKHNFGRVRRAVDLPDPAPAKPPIVSANAVFAVTALAFGVGLLCVWRFNTPEEDTSLSIMAVVGLLSLFCGGYAGISELGLLDAFGGGADGGSDGGDGGGD